MNDFIASICIMGVMLGCVCFGVILMNESYRSYVPALGGLISAKEECQLNIPRTHRCVSKVVWEVEEIK